MNLKELSPKGMQRLNKIMESRFGASIDYNKLSYGKAQRLSAALTEQLKSVRRSHGLHTAERNPKYMEMFMVREGINAWIEHQNRLMEGELETAEAVLAAKDMVDSIQSMIEDAGKMLNEQLPPLLDQIRDQVGTAQADAFKGTATASLSELMASLNAARDSLDSSARALTGEAPAPMGMDAGMDAPDMDAPDMAADLEPPMPDMGDDEEDLETDAPSKSKLGRGLR